MRNSLQINKAFSLIELMVVIAIVAVLAAIALPAYQQYVSKAKLAGPIAFAGEQAKAVVTYYTKNGTYPTNVNQIGLVPSLLGNPLATDYLPDPETFISPRVGNVTLQQGFYGPCQGMQVIVFATDFNSAGVFDGPVGAYYQFTHHIVEGSNGMMYDKCTSYGVQYDNGDPTYLNYNISACPDQISSAEYAAVMTELAGVCL